MNFTDFGLDPVLQDAVVRAGYDTPTPIQQAALPVALGGRDIIGTAQTGTGKTATFVLPMLQRLQSGPRKMVRCLVVTPTRELAIQIDETVKALGKGTGIRSATIFGGVNANPQIKALRSGAEILVACPGRLLDLLAQQHLSLKHLDILVLDEADRMFDMGFIPDIRRILAQVPSERQTMLFSATFPDEIEKLARNALTRPERIAVGMARPAHTVTHALYPVPHHLKTSLILRLLDDTGTGSVLVFTRTKHRASRLAQKIARTSHSVTCLHGDRSQGQRQAALAGFKAGAFRVMVATDIAARGIDVADITHVINFDMPDTEDAYIHRIGRTGRAEKDGDAFTFVTPEDEDMVRSLERIMKETIPRFTVDGFDYEKTAPPRQVQGPRKPREPRPGTTPGSRKKTGRQKAHQAKPDRHRPENRSGKKSGARKKSGQQNRPAKKSDKNIEWI